MRNRIVKQTGLLLLTGALCTLCTGMGYAAPKAEKKTFFYEPGAITMALENAENTEGTESTEDTENTEDTEQREVDPAEEIEEKRAGLRSKKAVYYHYRKGFFYESIPADVKKRMKGKSYRKNKHISWSDLRYVTVLHYDYDGEVSTGEIVVNKKIAKKVVKIFYKLYRKHYPIERMQLIDDYGADDDESMSANNTSAFNYRVVAGTSTLSDHAYGMAIDLNPRINPYVKNGKSSPKNGKVYKQRKVKKCRGKYRKNMIHKNDFCYKTFKKYGFSWGGDWRSPKDYQHFYISSK